MNGLKWSFDPVAVGLPEGAGAASSRGITTATDSTMAATAAVMPPLRSHRRRLPVRRAAARSMVEAGSGLSAKSRSRVRMSWSDMSGLLGHDRAERAAERLQALGGLALYGADGASEFARRLLDGEVTVEAEDEGGALARRQRREGGLHVQAGVVVGGAARRIEVPVDKQHAAGPGGAAFREEGADEDRPDVRVDARGIAGLAPVGVQPRDRGLHQVIGALP